MYLITELCAGGSLAERLEQQRTGLQDSSHFVIPTSQGFVM